MTQKQKTIVKIVLYLIGCAALVYLQFAFAAWDLNPANWRFDQRASLPFCFAIESFLLLFPLGCLIEFLEDKSK